MSTKFGSSEPNLDVEGRAKTARQLGERLHERVRSYAKLARELLAQGDARRARRVLDAAARLRDRGDMFLRIAARWSLISKSKLAFGYGRQVPHAWPDVVSRPWRPTDVRSKR